MIISTPLSLTKAPPSDWERWWQIWNENSKPFKKVTETHNREGQHFGFDLYKNAKYPMTYEAPLIDSKLLPELRDQIMDELAPINPFVIRFAMSMGNFPPHSDYRFPNWQVRSMFYHPDPTPQWYFTSMDESKIAPLVLPEETNWFAYLDGACKHATKFVPEHPKIIIQVMGQSIKTRKFVEEQIGTFPNHAISL